jgi:hypothetical protein
MLVMRAAEQPYSLDGVRVRQGKPVKMVEFQRTGLVAPPAALVGERAPSTIAYVDSTLDVIWNVPRRGGFFGRCLPLPS